MHTVLIYAVRLFKKQNYFRVGSPLLQPHCNANPIYVFLFCELRCLSPNFHIHVFVSDLCIPRIGPHISYSRIGRSIVGIYKSLTDCTWMWKLELWPGNFFPGNICLQFLVLVLCSAMRPKARGLTQHGGPESDPAGVILYAVDGPYHLSFPYCNGCPDRSCPAASWWNFQLLLYSKCTQPSVMSYVTQITLVDSCLLSG